MKKPIGLEQIQNQTRPPSLFNGRPNDLLPHQAAAAGCAPAKNSAKNSGPALFCSQRRIGLYSVTVEITVGRAGRRRRRKRVYIREEQEGGGGKGVRSRQHLTASDQVTSSKQSKRAAWRQKMADEERTLRRAS